MASEEAILVPLGSSLLRLSENPIIAPIKVIKHTVQPEYAIEDTAFKSGFDIT
jgi:hypothetical protein